jgi:hypothetical protein
LEAGTAARPEYVANSWIEGVAQQLEAFQQAFDSFSSSLIDSLSQLEEMGITAAPSSSSRDGGTRPQPAKRRKHD